MIMSALPIVEFGGMVRAFAQNEQACIIYDEPTNTIKISCPSSNMTTIYNSMNNDRILRQEKPGDWLLNASLLIEKNSSLTIDSSDTMWLKLHTPNGIISYGTITIDSVRITSWDSMINDFATTDGTIPRPYITMWEGGTGKMDITNSEISHLGYHVSHKQGLAYYSGNGSRLDNNNIHNMWYGFYSNAVSYIDITNNHIHNNEIYGLDPHTGTHDMLIRNNTVHDIRKGIGIICSHDCYNIIMEDNVVYNSDKVGIMFSRTTTNSTMRNNISYGNGGGISIHDLSSNNLIYNNTVYDNGYGIKISKNSSNNQVYNNTILNSTRYGVCLVEGTNNEGNKIFSNTIKDSSAHGICIFNGSSDNFIESNLLENTRTALYVIGPDARNNVFKSNQITNSSYAILLRNDTSTNFVSNTITDKSIRAEYYMVDSTLNLTNTTLSGQRFVGDGRSNVTISNSDPGIISGSDSLEMTVDRGGLLAKLELVDRERAFLNTAPFIVRSTDGSPVLISSLRYDLNLSEQAIQWTAQTNSQRDISYRIGGIKADTPVVITTSEGEEIDARADQSGYIEFTITPKASRVSYALFGQFDQPSQDDRVIGDPSDRNDTPDTDDASGPRVNEVGADGSFFEDRPEYRNVYFGCDLQVLGPCDPLANKLKVYLSQPSYSTITSLQTPMPEYVEGKYGQALKLKAEYREAVEITNSPVMHSDTFSVSFWIKPPETSERLSHLISHTNNHNTRGWYVQQMLEPGTNKQLLIFVVTSKEGKTTSAPPMSIENNQFTHISMTFSGSDIKVYRNGEQVSETRYEGDYVADPGLPLRIGSASFSASSNRWSGMIDDLVLFNRSLDQDEVRSIRASNTPFGNNIDSYSGITAYYPFDGNTLDNIGNNHGSQSTLLASMTFAPDGRMFFTEKNTGRILIMKDGIIQDRPFVEVSDVYVSWEQGMLGITLDPKFTENRFVYLYYTAIDEMKDEVYNKVVRFTDNNSRGENMMVLLDRIPAVKGYHSGGAVAFNPADDKLYITVGDATEHVFAQDPNTYLGKVLRIDRDGTIPEDNPFKNSPVYTIGSRNMYGLAFDAEGYGIMTENGEGIFDEINLIRSGANYGFPTMQPPNVAPELSDPSTSDWPLRSYRATPAPTQAIYYTGDKFPELKGKFLFGTFTGKIYALSIDKNSNQVLEELRLNIIHSYFTPVIGIAQSPDGDIYFGSYSILKLESTGYNSRQEVLFPVTVSVPEGVQVKELRVNTETNSLSLAFENGLEDEGYDIGIRIPRMVVDGVYQVLSGNGLELEYEVIPRIGTHGTGYTDIVVRHMEEGNKDSRIVISGAHIVPEFGSLTFITVSMTLVAVLAMVMIVKRSSFFGLHMGSENK
jgi:parallel beta-helix repeat protein